MLHLFRRGIRSQVNEFIDYKRAKNGIFVASHHKEWMMKFLYIIRKSDVYDLTLDDIYEYKDHLMNTLSGDYTRNEAMHSLRCFLRYHRRYDILVHMAKVGRKPNLPKIKEVQEYVRKGLSRRDIQAVLSRGGRRVHLTTVQLWAKYKL